MYCGKNGSTGVSIINNLFGRDCGGQVPGTLGVDCNISEIPLCDAISGNLWEDTLLPIPENQ